MVLKSGAQTSKPLPADSGITDHLDRLLAPDSAIPWYRAIFSNVVEFVRPEKLPPLEVTSKPVSLPETWGLYRVNRKSGVMSVAIHVGLLSLLWSITTSPPAPQLVKQVTTLIAPSAPFRPVEVKPRGGGGGGGRAITAFRSSARAPSKPVMRRFTPPPAPDATDAPKLLIPADWIGTADSGANFGSPLEGLPGAAGGFGTATGTGSGSGSGTGTGSGNGDGSGPAGGHGAGPGGPIFIAGKGITLPEPVFRPNAEYSEDARKAQLSGKVVLSVVVEADGTTSNITVTKGLGMGLDQKAIEAVRQWKFKPATMDGKPVRARVNVEVGFRLLVSMLSRLSINS